MEWPVPPFIKASEEASLFKECHLRESCKHWSQLCVFARPPELIPSNFSAPLVPVIKEACAFKWAGSLVALSSYHIGLQSGLQCEEGTGANHWALPSLKLYSPISLPLSLPSQSFHLRDKEANTASEEVSGTLFCDQYQCMVCSYTVLSTCIYIHTCNKKTN